MESSIAWVISSQGHIVQKNHLQQLNLRCPKNNVNNLWQRKKNDEDERSLSSLIAELIFEFHLQKKIVFHLQMHIFQWLPSCQWPSLERVYFILDLFLAAYNVPISASSKNSFILGLNIGLETCWRKIGFMVVVRDCCIPIDLRPTKGRFFIPGRCGLFIHID